MDAGSVESLFAGYPDVRLRLVSRSAHTSQVVTGFLMLARRRRIALTIKTPATGGRSIHIRIW